MKCYGLIGYPLSHSFSGKYFAEKFAREGISDCTYDLFPIERIDLLLPLINGNMELLGLNVTIPYKEQVIPYLNDIDEDAANIGAVNTIRITRNSGKTFLKGYNTDVYGFSESLRPLLTQRYKNALILGTGGASKAVAYALKKWEYSGYFCVQITHKQQHHYIPHDHSGDYSKIKDHCEYESVGYVSQY